MRTLPATLRAWSPRTAGLTSMVLLLGLMCLISACQGQDPGPTVEAADGTLTPAPISWRATSTPEPPILALSILTEELKVEPTPLRAGHPFTITGLIHNDSPVSAGDVPVLIHLSANQEKLGYTSYVELLTVTLAASQTVPITVPVRWNLAGGEHRLWVQVNHLPHAWQPRAPTQPEENLADNLALVDLMIDPFDAYSSELCPGRVDLEISPSDVLPDPERQVVLVLVHNLGNKAAYNAPVIALGRNTSGMAYTPIIPPCGGTARVEIAVDEPFEEGAAFSVRVNPEGWEDGLVEDNYTNNAVSVAAGLPGAVQQQLSSLQDYDFSIDAGEIEVPELGVLLIRVYNHGTRDAANVPIRVTDEAGHKLNDVVPLVQGSGSGVVAIRVASLWKAGVTLTLTVNPEDAGEGYPEVDHQNNAATFSIP